MFFNLKTIFIIVKCTNSPQSGEVFPQFVSPKEKTLVIDQELKSITLTFLSKPLKFLIITYNVGGYVFSTHMPSFLNFKKDF
jgi:hypothetical protein